VTLVSADNPWGQRFRTFGFPAGARAGAWASGVLRDREGTGWLQIDGEATTGRRVGPGFSGAPVLVQDEALPGVVGMVVAADRQDRDRVAFVIPTATLLQAWPTVLGQRTVAACPYRGLSAFRERDAEFFFGREEQVPRLVETVRHQRVIAVLGPSGSGKSSLVLAGLLPALRSDEGLQIGSFRPGRDPFGKLALALLPLLDPTLGEASRLEEAAALDECSASASSRR
jgi:hypothetical protein